MLEMVWSKAYLLPPPPPAAGGGGGVDPSLPPPRPRTRLCVCVCVNSANWVYYVVYMPFQADYSFANKFLYITKSIVFVKFYLTDFIFNLLMINNFTFDFILLATKLWSIFS